MCERAEKYLRGLIEATNDIIYKDEAKEVVEMAKRYIEDTRYYLGKGDCETALVTASYAEGLLDALRMLGLAEFKWPERKQRKVVVGGTFDLIHPGHVELFKEASKLGDVIAIVARDETVKKLRGREPVLNQDQRAYMVSSLKYVKKAIVGGRDPIETVVLLKPDYILLGPDQNWNEEELERELRRRGLKTRVLRMKEKKCIPRGLCSSSKIVKRVLDLFCDGNGEKGFGRE